MATAQDLIMASLRLLQVASDDVVVTTSEMTSGLESLNMLIESLSLDPALVNTLTREKFTITPNDYISIGSVGGGGGGGGGGGDVVLGLNTVRPIRIIEACFAATGTNVDFSLQIVEADDYEAVQLKTLTAAYPQYLYYDRASPFGKIYLYPRTTGGVLTLESIKPLATYATLLTTLSLSPGFYRLLKAGLAMELAPEYQVTVGDGVVQMYKESVAMVKRMNARTPTMRTDVGLNSHGSAARYNIYRNG